MRLCNCVGMQLYGYAYQRVLYLYDNIIIMYEDRRICCYPSKRYPVLGYMALCCAATRNLAVSCFHILFH